MPELSASATTHLRHAHPMRIVQTVFGVFHHFDLARELRRRGHLTRIYSTWPWQRIQREGIPKESVRTFPWIHTPEFLLRRAGLLPGPIEDLTGYLNALSFDEYTARTLPECDALIGISGSSLKTGRMLQERGGIFLCDRGSTHQRFQEELVTDEYRRWGVTAPVSDPRDTAREEEIYAIADGITVPSTFSARSFLAMGVDPAKLYTIPYGVRLERFKPFSEPSPESLELLFVGTVGLRKGLPYLLEAFARVKHPHKRLRIVGSVSREFIPVLARLPKENVEILGSRPQDEVAKMMSESHLLVLPSIEDGFGMVLGQALACGCVILASTNTGAPDFIDDGVEGFIVPIRDIDALVSRMERIAADPALHSRMRAAGLERVKSIGGWSTYGDRWESLLSTLIEAKNR